MSEASISIVLNGDEAWVPPGMTLRALVEEHLERDVRTVAVELNGEIVPRATYEERPLAAGDRLEVVHFVQGG